MLYILKKGGFLKKILIMSVWGLVLFQTIVYSQTLNLDKYGKEMKEYIYKGNTAYLKKDYNKAIKYYSKAIELDKKNPVLDTNVWRIIVDNLGMSYGISGNPYKAIDIYKKALIKDPEYPMFYYNLACAYAEVNNLDSAIVNLKLAFKFVGNMIQGEKIPDPQKDSSFSKYLTNELFRNAIEEIINNQN